MKKSLLLLVGAGILAGCSSPHEDLQEWMQNTRKEASAKVHKIEPPTLAVAQDYKPLPVTGMNSFDSARLKAGMQGSNSPNFNRPREVLENFSLESLKYVGSLQPKGSGMQAFISAGGHVYTVRVGNYMGQNFGRITAITPNEIIITEQVEDTYGNWTNRRISKPLEGGGTSTAPSSGGTANSRNQ